MEALQSQHQAEIDRLRDQVRYDPPTRDSDDELTELKRRLCLLEEGYEAQIAALKKQYQEALGSQSDICEENIRQRYQFEIERLRVSLGAELFRTKLPFQSSPAGFRRPSGPARVLGSFPPFFVGEGPRGLFLTHMKSFIELRSANGRGRVTVMVAFHVESSLVRDTTVS